MKFDIAKLPKNISQKYRKNFKRKENENNSLEFGSIEDKKVNINLCYDKRKKVLLFSKCSVFATGPRWALPPILVQ